MDSAICNVRDIETDKRRWIETIVGQPLQDNQQIAIRVIDSRAVPDQEARDASHVEAAEIARQGRLNAAARGVTEEDIDAAVNDARAHVSHRSR